MDFAMVILLQAPVWWYDSAITRPQEGAEAHYFLQSNASKSPLCRLRQVRSFPACMARNGTACGKRGVRQRAIIGQPSPSSYEAFSRAFAQRKQITRKQITRLPSSKERLACLFGVAGRPVVVGKYSIHRL